jgi:type VI secretion system secreted protein VgrG
MNIVRITLILLCLLPCIGHAQSSKAAGVPKEIALLAEELRQVKAELASLHDVLGDTQAELAALQQNTVLGLDDFLKLITDSTGNPVVVLTGANLQVVNGTGMTGTGNGKGNIVLGYNNTDVASQNRQGSHNLVVGDDNAYPGTSEVLVDRIVAARDLGLIVGGQMNLVVGTVLDSEIGADSRESIGGNKIENVGANRSETVGGDKIENVAANRSATVGGNESVSVGASTFVTSAQSVVVESGDTLILKSGSAIATLDKSGDIALNGKDVAIKGSGEVEVAASGDLVLKGRRILQN